MTDDLLETAIAIAREAAELANRLRIGGVTVAATKSSAVDAVTIVDREVESLIRRRIAEHFPEDAILGEEEGSTALGASRTWIVDPIDGTANLLYGIPQYGVSIAVVEGDPTNWRWDPMVGVVINPPTGDEFWATRGGGAFHNGEPARIRRADSLEQSLLATGFAYDAATRRMQATVLVDVIEHVRDIRRFGACSLDLCALAIGRVDAYFERTLSAWDFAAGLLIAREAGAEIRGWDGAPPSADWLLAAHPERIDDLDAVLVAAGAHHPLN